MELNPYAPPQVPSQDETVDDLVAVRRRHLWTEVIIQTLGLFFIIAGATGVLGIGCSLLMLLVTDTRGSGPQPTLRVSPAQISLLLLAIVVGTGYFLVGVGLRQLNPQYRRAAILCCLPTIAAFPLGTLVTGLGLYALLRSRGRYLFTPEYHRTIDATPQILPPIRPVLLLLLCTVGSYAIGVPTALVLKWLSGR